MLLHHHGLCACLTTPARKARTFSTLDIKGLFREACLLPAGTSIHTEKTHPLVRRESQGCEKMDAMVSSASSSWKLLFPRPLLCVSTDTKGVSVTCILFSLVQAEVRETHRYWSKEEVPGSLGYN